MAKEEQWEPLDVQRIAKQAADMIDAWYDPENMDGPFSVKNHVENAVKKLLLEERAYFAKVLLNPVMVRINMMRGGIARPVDLVWLHDTDGPVAEKVRKAVEDQIELDAEIAAASDYGTQQVAAAIRKQKRKK